MSEVILARYSVVVQPDGSIRSIVSGVDPKTFLEKAKEADPKWEEATTVSLIVKFVLEHFESFDKELDRYINSL